MCCIAEGIGEKCIWQGGLGLTIQSGRSLPKAPFSRKQNILLVFLMSLPTFLRQSLFTDDTPFLDDAFQLFLFDQELSGSYYIETKLHQLRCWCKTLHIELLKINHRSRRQTLVTKYKSCQIPKLTCLRLEVYGKGTSIVTT